MLLLAGEDDLRDVISAVTSLAGRWNNLGTSLGVRPGDLETILSAKPHSPSDCLRDMLLQWLRQSCLNVCTTLILYLNTYYVTVVCPSPLISQGGEVKEANLENAGGGCGGLCRRQQPCSGPNNSRRSPW